MISEVEKYLKKVNKVKRVGILATNGTVESKVYSLHLEKCGFDVVYPEYEVQGKVTQCYIR